MVDLDRKVSKGHGPEYSAKGARGHLGETIVLGDATPKMGSLFIDSDYTLDRTTALIRK